MRKGQGYLQQRLVAILEERDALLDTFELAADAYAVQPDETGAVRLAEKQLVSVRRALRGLANRGVIADLGRHWDNGRQRWASAAAAKRYHQRVRNAFAAR